MTNGKIIGVISLKGGSENFFEIFWSPFNWEVYENG